MLYLHSFSATKCTAAMIATACVWIYGKRKKEVVGVVSETDVIADLKSGKRIKEDGMKGGMKG